MSPLSPCWGRGGRVTLLGTGAVTLVETGDALVGTWCCVTPLGTCRPPTPPRHPAGDIGVVTPPAVRCWWGCVTLWGGQGGVTALGTGGCHPWGGVQQAVTARVTPTGTHGGPRAPHCACARRAQQTARAHTPRPHGPRTAHARSIASGPAHMRTHSPAAPHACAFAPPAPPVAAHMRTLLPPPQAARMRGAAAP